MMGCRRLQSDDDAGLPDGIPRTLPPVTVSMHIGTIQIDPLLDGSGTEAAGEIISRFSRPDAWRDHPEVFGDDGSWTFPVGGFLIRSDSRIVVVDTGVGPMGDGRYVRGGLLNALRSFGVEPSDVTDVVFTHLHFDHVGWASINGAATFPNATYRVHAADWAHFVEGPDAVASVQDKLWPVHEQFEFFDQDFRIAPGVESRWVPGHTPGSIVILVASGEDRAILLGDAVHAVVQLAEDDWTVVWDHDPVTASAARNALADEAATNGDLVVAAHFPGMRFGRVRTDAGQRQFVPVG